MLDVPDNRKNLPPSPWTDEKVARLRKMHATSTSYPIIADELGVSKNAVAGKVLRLGLDKRKNASKRNDGGALARRLSGKNGNTDRVATQRIVRLNKQRVFGGPILNVIEAKIHAPDPDLEDSNAAIPQEQRCTILDLDNEKCHWPCGEVGQPGFFFCGGKTDDKPYCTFHMKAAYYPPKPRVERPYLPLGGSKPRVI